ncbi:MAG: peptide chain release factor N(5)-glutamine methyltransferase [Acidobacteria bacterium]|nr:peptide chain release factor N(5)-glutamine methyltransferase [Acidobacteriota bacterium]
MTVRQALQQGTELLEKSGIAAPRLTAEVLLSHAARQPRQWLYAHATDPLQELWWIHYGRYLHERLNGKPTQYITGIQEFYGRDFQVAPAVLIPRPETELLIEAVLEKTKGGRIADIGTGSGAIAVTLALEASECAVVATDISAAALVIARANAARHEANNIAFLQSDLLSAFAPHSLDAVVSNPPYIPKVQAATLQREVVEHEPHLALFSEEDGMQHYRRLVEQSKVVLKPGGWLILELAFDAVPKLEPLLPNAEIRNDLAGHPRVAIAQNSK